jgi:hypothetical protein
MATATLVGLGSVKAMVTAAHSYAVLGEALALFVVLGLGLLWTRVLRRRQADLSPRARPSSTAEPRNA